ncbi:MAG: helix-turn-helix transcriptional regulator, partial [Chloroflexi bacterium]|nr:helix-turn-helix transcriptional regulator [Chloroflexota bacterium]
MIEVNKVKGSPRQRHSTLVRRTEIIEAAKKIIVKFGSEHVTIKRLASEVGISQGAIYRHFR